MMIKVRERFNASNTHSHKAEVEKYGSIDNTRQQTPYSTVHCAINKVCVYVLDYEMTE